MSVFFAIVLCFAKMGGDDITGMRVEGGSLADYWEYSVYYFSVWASRIFVNFVVFIFTDTNTIWWAIYMGVSIYVLLYSISTLFVENNKKACNLFITALVFMYPFRDLTTAGWIATMTTYLSPIAFGFLALIPIKKIIKNEKNVWWEYILYSIALIYGSNNEQMMVVVLGSYIVAAIYFLLNKKVKIYFCVQLLLSLISCGIVMFCPGNYARKKAEIVTWYPTYGMIDKIDQIDLGYSTTMKWLFFGGNTFVIICCALLMYIVWKKYTSYYIRIISVIPTMFTFFGGPLNQIISNIYPSIVVLNSDISKTGLVTVENRGGLAAFGTYLIWSILLIILVVELILVQENLKKLIATITLLVCGVASRVAIGFSPTIFQSGYRTCAVMSFCIIGTICMVYAECVNHKILTKKEISIINIVMGILLIFGMTDFMFLVANMF